MNISKNESTYVEMKNIYDVPRITYGDVKLNIQNTSSEVSNVGWVFPHLTSVSNREEKLYNSQPIKIDINLKHEVFSNDRLDAIKKEEKTDGNYTENKIQKSSLNNRKSLCSLKRVICLGSLALGAFVGIGGMAYASRNYLSLKNNSDIGEKSNVETTSGNYSLINERRNIDVVVPLGNMSHSNSPYRGYINTATQENFKKTTTGDVKKNTSREQNVEHLTRTSKIESVYFKEVILKHDLGKKHEKKLTRKITETMEIINKFLLISCRGSDERQILLEMLSPIKLLINLYNKEEDCRQALNKTCPVFAKYNIDMNKNQVTTYLDDGYNTKNIGNGYFSYIRHLLRTKDLDFC